MSRRAFVQVAPGRYELHSGSKEAFRLRKFKLLVPLIARHLIESGIGIAQETFDRIEQEWGDAEWRRLAAYVNQEHQLRPRMGTPSAESRRLILAGLRQWAGRKVARRLATTKKASK